MSVFFHSRQCHQLELGNSWQVHYASVRLCKCESFWVWEYTSVGLCESESMRAWKYASVKICECESMREWECANEEVQKLESWKLESVSFSLPTLSIRPILSPLYSPPQFCFFVVNFMGSQQQISRLEWRPAWCSLSRPFSPSILHLFYRKCTRPVPLVHFSEFCCFCFCFLFFFCPLSLPFFPFSMFYSFSVIPFFTLNCISWSGLLGEKKYFTTFFFKGNSFFITYRIMFKCVYK